MQRESPGAAEHRPCHPEALPPASSGPLGTDFQLLTCSGSISMVRGSGKFCFSAWPLDLLVLLSSFPAQQA